MPNTKAIDRFLESEQPPDAPREKGASNKSPTILDEIQPKKILGTLGQFFVPTPIVVDHPSTEGVKRKEIQVARYGRIYKRKMHSATLGYKPPPCPDGYRYCRECGESRPEAEFYEKIRRYICRRHHYERVRARFVERMTGERAAPARNAEGAWIDLSKLCRMLGYDKVRYDRHDIMDLITNCNIPLSVRPRVAPIDPTRPLRPRNVAILQYTDSHLLKTIYERTCSVAIYIQFVQACNLIPRNADAGIPWDPFHDPNYARDDVDVTDIVRKEFETPQERPVIDAVQALRDDPLPE